jgi:hypothetical protein
MSHRTARRAAKSVSASAPAPASAMPAAPPLVVPAWLKSAIVLLAAALLFVWFTPEVADSDTWWQLRTGQYIVQTHKLAVPDPFAFTTRSAGVAYPDEPIVRHFNLTHEWLAEAIVYLVYAAGGFAGMVIFRALLLMVTCAFSGLVAYKRTSSFYWSVAAAVAVGTVANRYTADRPFLFSFLLAAATFAILEYRRCMWALPPIFLVWANLHGGFFLGWVILGVYCADAVISRRAKLTPQDRKLFLIAAISTAVSTINPNFLEPLRMTMLYRESKLQVRLWEWQHTALWPPEPFQIMLFVGIAVMLIAARRVRFMDWVFFLGFAFAAVWAVRNVILFAIVAPFLIAAYFPWKRALPPIGEFAAAALLLLGFGAAVSQGGGLQFRAAEWKYPWGAAKFLEDHHITAPMLNSYMDGGFLMWRLWPQEKVFIDGRALSDRVFEDFTKIVYNVAGSDPRQLMAKWGIETIVLEGFEYTGGDPFRLVAVLGLDRPVEWHLVYWDATAVVFMRHLPQGVAPLDNAYALNAMEAQCQNYIAHDPYHPRCARGMGLLYRQIGDTARARNWIRYYLDHATGADPEANQIYGRLIAGEHQ